MPCTPKPSLQFNGSCSEEEACQLLGQAIRNDKTSVETYLDRVGCPASIRWWPRIALMTNHFAYYIQSPGDCGASQAKITVGTGFAGVGTQIAGVGTAAAGGVAALAGGSAAAAAGSATASLALTATGIGAIAGLALIPFAIIGAHHAAAVAAESSLLCDVTASYNGWYDQIEQLLKSGQIALNDALVALDQVQTALLNAIEPLAHPTNGPELFKYCVKAVMLQNRERVFPSLVPPPLPQKIAAALTSGLAGTNGSTGASGAIAIGALGLLALLAKLLIGA